MARKKEEKDEGLKLGEFNSAISQICEEKGISKDKVIETIEAALAAAYKKEYGRRGQNVDARFDEKTGSAKFFRLFEVVDESVRDFTYLEEEEQEPARNATHSVAGGEDMRSEEVLEEETDEEKMPRFNSERDVALEEAKKKDPDVKLGDFIEEALESNEDFGRVAAQTAKQVIIQRIREAERDAMYDEYKSKEGEVVSGSVQRIEGRNVFIDLGKSVGVLFPSEQPEREQYRIGQRMKVFVVKVEADPKGPGIVLSRARNELVQKLFELEVPEIFAGTVEIQAIAREAGSRTKIAVSSNEDGIDPIGSCVGQKGTRVQAVIDELGGEKIDIIEWNDDVAKFISAALSPAKVLKVDIKEARKEATVLVPNDQLSLAIGKQGQNVRLAAKLTGWKIDVNGEDNEEKKDDKKEIASADLAGAMADKKEKKSEDGEKEETVEKDKDKEGDKNENKKEESAKEEPEKKKVETKKEEKVESKKDKTEEKEKKKASKKEKK